MAQYNLITDIPSVLAIECLVKWLPLKDVCLLDSAYCCCKKEREVLLALIGSPEFVVTQQTNIDDCNLTRWLSKRSIRVTSIEVLYAWERAEILEYLSMFGSHVRSVQFNSHFSNNKVISCLKTRCRHLTALTGISGCYISGPNKVFVETILLNNPGLERLELVGVGLDCRRLQGISWSKLKRLKLTYSNLSEKFCKILSVSVAHNIERLDLSFSNCKGEASQMFWCSFRNVRALQVRRCNIMNDQHLQSIASNCPLIVHLNLCDCHFITDIGMRDIAMNLTQLRSLDIRYCRRLTDLTMQYLTQYRADNLLALYFDMRHFSHPYIMDLFHCAHNLIEVGVCVKSESDTFWENIFQSAPTIRKWVFRPYSSLSEVPFTALAHHCHQLRELHIYSAMYSFSNEEVALLSLLDDCPLLQVLKLTSYVYHEVVGSIKNVYPHLYVELINDFYQQFDALAQPL